MIRLDSLAGRWPHRRLGEVVEFLDHLRRPVKESERVEGPYPYFGANGQQGTIDGYLFDEPLVLLAEDGGHFGEPDRTVAYRVAGKCWVNNHAHVLRPRSGIDIDFLCRHIEYYDVRPFVTGSTRGKLTQAAAARIPVVVPPLPEQRRIAALLDKADAIPRKRQQAIRLADDLLRSAFLEMFGDPVTNPKGWPTLPIAELAEVVTGNTPPRERPEYYGDAIEWIKSDNINTPSHILTRAVEGLSEAGRALGRTAPEGSTLMTCIAGSQSCIGNVALTDRAVALNQQINAIVPGPSVDANFLYVQLLLAKPLVQAASTNSMKGMVSKGRLSSVHLPAPPEERQRAFGRWVSRFLLWRSSLDASSGATDDLFHALAQRAFRGVGA